MTRGAQKDARSPAPTRYRRITVKLAANLLFVVAGFAWFVPWLDRLAAMSRLTPTLDPGYHAAMRVYFAMAGAQALLVLAMVIVSVFRPWGRTGLDW